MDFIRRSSAPGGGGEVNVESGAFAHLRMHMHGASGLFEQAVDNGQAKPRPFARRFGRKIRLKNLGQYVRRNARPVITHGDEKEGGSADKSFSIEDTVRGPFLDLGEI